MDLTMDYHNQHEGPYRNCRNPTTEMVLLVEGGCNVNHFACNSISKTSGPPSSS